MFENRILLVFFFVLGISGFSFSQSRSNAELPVITDTGKVLSEITGWRKDSNGQWVSAKNEIPPKWKGADRGHEPYYDNIQAMKLYNVSFKGAEYIVLAIAWENTVYQYPAIYKGRYESKRTDYFVFTNNTPFTFKLTPDTKAKVYMNFYSYTWLGGSQTMQDAIAYTLNNPRGVGSIDSFSKKSIQPVELYAYYFAEDNVVRFLLQFPEKLYYSSYSAINELPDDFYFEVDLDNFNKIFSVKK